MCIKVSIFYTLADSTFLITNQLLMIHPVILAGGRKVGGQLLLDDKSTDFRYVPLIHKDYPVPSGNSTCFMLIGMFKKLLKEERKRGQGNVNKTHPIISNPIFINKQYYCSENISK